MDMFNEVFYETFPSDPDYRKKIMRQTAFCMVEAVNKATGGLVRLAHVVENPNGYNALRYPAWIMVHLENGFPAVRIYAMPKGFLFHSYPLDLGGAVRAPMYYEPYIWEVKNVRGFVKRILNPDRAKRGPDTNMVGYQLSRHVLRANKPFHKLISALLQQLRTHMPLINPVTETEQHINACSISAIRYAIDAACSDIPKDDIYIRALESCKAKIDATWNKFDEQENEYYEALWTVPKWVVHYENRVGWTVAKIMFQRSTVVELNEGNFKFSTLQKYRHPTFYPSLDAMPESFRTEIVDQLTMLSVQRPSEIQPWSHENYRYYMPDDSHGLNGLRLVSVDGGLVNSMLPVSDWANPRLGAVFMPSITVSSQKISMMFDGWLEKEDDTGSQS